MALTGVVSDMFPTFSINNIINGAKRNAIFFGELEKHTVPMNILCSNLKHLLSSKARTILAFTMRYAPFLHCILSILFNSSKKEVIGTDTQAVITVMTYQQAIGNGTISKFVGYTVNKLASAKVAHISISGLGFGSHPGPACIGVRSVNLTPQALCQVTLTWGRMIGHLLNLLYRLVGVRLGAIPESPTPPHYTTSSRLLSSFMEVQ